MKVIDQMKCMSVDEFIDWLDKYIAFDSAPWMYWYDKNYCQKCEPVIKYDDSGGSMEYAWCEMHGKCKFFEHMSEVPSTKETIKMWLESESNYGV